MTVTLKEGRVCMSDAEVELLAKTVACPGDHLEIGSMWGGTAIVAALSKGGRGRIVCVDPFSDSDAAGGKPNPDIFNANLADAGVRAELHVAQSLPWPFNGREFSTILIDGCHQDNWPQQDWDNASKAAPVILIHDVRPGESAVQKMVNGIGGDWRLRAQADSLVVYERTVPA